MIAKDLSLDKIQNTKVHCQNIMLTNQICNQQERLNNQMCKCQFYTDLSYNLVKFNLADSRSPWHIRKFSAIVILCRLLAFIRQKTRNKHCLQNKSILQNITSKFLLMPISCISFKVNIGQVGYKTIRNTFRLCRETMFNW